MIVRDPALFHEAAIFFPGNSPDRPSRDTTYGGVIHQPTPFMGEENGPFENPADLVLAGGVA
jgi:hypothetical protein